MITLKRIANIALNILLYLFFTVCILVLVLTLLSKKDVDGAAELFGYQMRIVVSDSMDECEFTDVSGYEIGSIPLRSMIFVKTIPDDPAEADEFYRSLKKGDVLTFRYLYNKQVTITHRISQPVSETEGGYVILLSGDNTTSETGALTQTIDTSVANNPNYVIGKVVGQSYLFGAIMSFLTQPAGIILLIILPCAIIILLEILKIVKALTSDKRKQAEEEKAKKDAELEELRARLAELEGKNNNP